jgi:hypothetical protein
VPSGSSGGEGGGHELADAAAGRAGDHLRARWDSGYLGKGIRCIVCVSAYTAAAAALLLGLLGLYDVWLWPIVWLGLAGASVKIDLWWKR